MRRICRVINIIGLLFMLSACATWSTSEVKKDGLTISPTPQTVQKSPKDIIVTEADITDRKYKALGDIEVTVNKTTIFHSDPTPEKVKEELQKEAAKLGADAVILVRYGTVGVSFMSWGSLNGKGRAVIFLQ